MSIFSGFKKEVETTLGDIRSLGDLVTISQLGMGTEVPEAFEKILILANLSLFKTMALEVATLEMREEAIETSQIWREIAGKKRSPKLEHERQGVMTEEAFVLESLQMGSMAFEAELRRKREKIWGGV